MPTMLFYIPCFVRFVFIVLLFNANNEAPLSIFLPFPLFITYTRQFTFPTRRLKEMLGSSPLKRMSLQVSAFGWTLDTSGFFPTKIHF